MKPLTLLRSEDDQVWTTFSLSSLAWSQFKENPHITKLVRGGTKFYINEVCDGLRDYNIVARKFSFPTAADDGTYLYLIVEVDENDPEADKVAAIEKIHQILLRMHAHGLIEQAFDENGYYKPIFVENALACLEVIREREVENVDIFTDDGHLEDAKSAQDWVDMATPFLDQLLNLGIIPTYKHGMWNEYGPKGGWVPYQVVFPETKEFKVRKPESKIEEILPEIPGSHGAITVGVTENEISYPTPAGDFLVIPDPHSKEGEFEQEIDYVRFVNATGEELVYFASDEWEENPQGVMAQIIQSIFHGAPEMSTPQHTTTHLPPHEFFQKIPGAIL